MNTLQEQRANCEKLVSILEQVPDEKYDHSNFVRQHNECGTKACALGHAAISGQFPDLQYVERIEGFVNNLGGRISGPGISRSANSIFGSDAYANVFNDVGYDDAYRDWGRIDVIEALRRHMEGLV